MKTKLLVSIFFFFVTAQIINAQKIGTCQVTIGHKFIKGISPVNNTITFSAPGAYYIDFYIADPYFSYYFENSLPYIAYDSLIDYTGGNSTKGVVSNMGGLDTAMVIYAVFYDNALGYLGYNYYYPTIIPQPAWLTTTYQGSYSNLQVNIGTNKYSLHGRLPVNAVLDSLVPSNIKGIAGKAFKLTNIGIDFDLLYDMASGNTTVINQPSVSVDLTPLGKVKNGNTSNFSGTLTVNSSFDLIFNSSVTWSPNSFKSSLPITKIPIVGPACFSLDASVDIAPKFKTQLVVGISGGKWGFINSGGNVTQILGKIKTSASVEGRIEAVCGFSLIPPIARGKITASLDVGGGINYQTLPSTSITKMYGGDFEVTGEIEVLGGLWSKSGYLYNPPPWGNLPNFRFENSSVTDDFLKFSANTFFTSSPITPESWPKGLMSTRDSLLAVVWMDNINVTGNKKYLLITYYDPYSNSFTYPQVIAYNDSLIENPTVSLMPSNRSLITWSQYSFPSNQIDTSNINFDNVSKQQDIWFAIFDNVTQAVIYKGKITDNGNRPDGNPKVTWGAGNKGIISWMVGDTINMGNKIYFTEVTENGNNYNFTSPTAISNTPGYNYSLHVSYYNSTAALAEWINDPDMNDSTLNSKVLFSTWDGLSWSSPVQRYNISSGVRIKDITASVCQQYGVDAVTYNYYNVDSTLINGVLVNTWNSSNPTAINSIPALEDSAYVFQLPRSAVSKNGIASFIMQTRDVYDANDYGMMELYVNDLNYGIGWLYASYSPVVSDTSEFTWDMSSVFGYLQSASSSDVMYLFTQEMDTSGNTHPTYGSIFGNSNLNLVLRAFEATSNGGNITLTYFPVPNLLPVSVFYQDISPFNYDFELKQNYPNPFNQQTIISFHIMKESYVKLEVFDIAGRLIATFFDKKLSPGDYQTEFDSGNLESGIYYYKMTANNSTLTKKMIIAK